MKKGTYNLIRNSFFVNVNDSTLVEEVKLLEAFADDCISCSYEYQYIYACLTGL